MRSQLFFKAFLSLLIISLTLPAFSTDGYLGVGIGTLNKGTAGAGIGMHYNSIIGGNPAGNVFIGNQYAISLGVFNPVRQFTVTEMPSMAPNSFGLMPGTVKSESSIFILPSVGANWNIDDNNAFAISIYGNGGMNTDYDAAVFYDESSPVDDGYNFLGSVKNITGVNLSQMFTELTYSRKVVENHSLGVSGIFGFQVFEAKGLNTFGAFGLSMDPTALSNNGKDNAYGFGFKAGYLGKFGDQFTVGATFQSKIYMSTFDKYAGLFAEGGDFDVPANWTIGLSFKPVDDLVLMLDFKQILYSQVNAVANPMNPVSLFPGYVDEMGNPQMNPAFVPLGDENGAGFGWKNMQIVKFGAEYRGLDNWAFRTGYSFGTQPVPEEEVMFNILAPGVIQHHVALGFSRDLVEDGPQLHFSFNYALNNHVTGINPLDPVQTIDLEMHQLEFEVGVTF